VLGGTGAVVSGPRPGVLAALIDLHHPDHYLHVGFIYISAANLVVIGVLVAVFVLAILLPFPGTRRLRPGTDGVVEPAAAVRAGLVDASVVHDAEALTTEDSAMDPEDARMWTAKLRRAGLKLLPPKRLLPDRQPAYVASWIYVFGVLTLSAFAVVVISGLILAIKGPTWWHETSTGHFVNSTHLWSVELFMLFMTVHLWGKFSMAAWRGRRALTWMTGVLAFVLSIVEAFTGYLSQTNFDSQWIAFESKDAFNAGGIGALINPMNFGQALMLHIVLIPLVLGLVIVVHILLVRIRGVVHPLPARRDATDRFAENTVEPSLDGRPGHLERRATTDASKLDGDLVGGEVS
jgi:hypothetical protein